MKVKEVIAEINRRRIAIGLSSRELARVAGLKPRAVKGWLNEHSRLRNEAVMTLMLDTVSLCEAGVCWYRRKRHCVNMKVKLQNFRKREAMLLCCCQSRE